MTYVLSSQNYVIHLLNVVTFLMTLQLRYILVCENCLRKLPSVIFSYITLSVGCFIFSPHLPFFQILIFRKVIYSFDEFNTSLLNELLYLFLSLSLSLTKQFPANNEKTSKKKKKFYEKRFHQVSQNLLKRCN